jgi:hypothetical protein
MAITALWLGLATAHAFPPAPDVIVFGMARDQYGVPLANPADTVILQTANGVQVVGSIQPNLAIGVNYAVQVPMDAGNTPIPYVANALTTGAAYKLYVQVNSITNLPLEMVGPNLSLVTPAQKFHQNLTLGADANGDGIPDAWETAFLNSIGTNIALANINPNGIYTGDGRTLLQEYLLGNFPYNPNAFSIAIVSESSGSAVIAFTTTAGHTFTVYGSTDLKNWTQLSFTIPSVNTQVQNSFTPSVIQQMQIQTVQPTNAPPIEFFRMQLQ